MPDILSPIVTVQKRVKTRASEIVIQNPETGRGDKVVTFATEHVTFLDGERQTAISGAPVVRRVADVAAETVTVVDPGTGQTVTISVAGIAAAIEQAYVDWYQEDVAAAAAAAAAAATP